MAVRRDSDVPLATKGGSLYLKNAHLDASDMKRFIGGIEYIQGIKPCVERLNTATSSPNFGKYELMPYSVAYGCTEANFRIVEPYQIQTAPSRVSELRRPSYRLFDVNLAKSIPVTEKTRLQFRLEAFNILNTPMYDERDYQRSPTNSEFGSISKGTVFQSNFPRQIQVAVKFLF